MQLTTQMKAEIKAMQIRNQHLIQKVCPLIGEAVSLGIKEIIHTSIQEMATYKVRLENLLCETDIKEQGHLWRKF